MAVTAEPRSRGVRPVSLPARRGGVQVSEMQRSRMLRSAVQVVAEMGYGKMSVARVTSRAHVSRRTFYDFFEDREDCFLTVFDDAVTQVTKLVACAYQGERGTWRAQVRAALTALLVFLDEQPEMGSLLVVNALRAGPRVLQRRAEALERVGAVLDDTGARAKDAREASSASLTGEGVVGAVFSVIHTRLLAKRPGSLVELINPLMSMIVLPYQGPAAAQKELVHSAPEIAIASENGQFSRECSSSGPISTSDPLADLPMRLTYRTLRVLAALGERPGASNREVADMADVTDQGQISKLLGRLERLGLVHNTGPGRQPHGEPNAWWLTARGLEVRRVTEFAATGQKPSRGVQRDEKKEKAT